MRDDLEALLGLDVSGVRTQCRAKLCASACSGHVAAVCRGHHASGVSQPRMGGGIGLGRGAGQEEGTEGRREKVGRGAARVHVCTYARVCVHTYLRVCTRICVCACLQSRVHAILSPVCLFVLVTVCLARTAGVDDGAPRFARQPGMPPHGCSAWYGCMLCMCVCRVCPCVRVECVIIYGHSYGHSKL